MQTKHAKKFLSSDIYNQFPINNIHILKQDAVTHENNINSQFLYPQMKSWSITTFIHLCVYGCLRCQGQGWRATTYIMWSAKPGTFPTWPFKLSVPASQSSSSIGVSRKGLCEHPNHLDFQRKDYKCLPHPVLPLLEQDHHHCDKYIVYFCMTFCIRFRRINKGLMIKNFVHESVLGNKLNWDVLPRRLRCFKIRWVKVFYSFPALSEGSFEDESSLTDDNIRISLAIPYPLLHLKDNCTIFSLTLSQLNNLWEYTYEET